MSSPSSSTEAEPPVVPPPQSKVTVYDFTKRRKWLDQMIGEVADGLVFIVSPTNKVIFCTGCGGTEFSETGLGWTDNDFLGGEFTDFINEEDLEHFTEDFNLVLESKNKRVITTYARLKPQQSPTILPAIKLEEIPYELKLTAHPHPGNPASTIIVVVAQQFRGGNQFMYSEQLFVQVAGLMQENEALEERIQYLRAQLPPELGGDPATAPPDEPVDSVYSSSDLTVKLALQQGGKSSGNAANTGLANQPSSSAMNTDNEGEATEDGAKRKKRLKKTHGVEQYVCVTCGRTSSPEWRKGPLGPKTLCNACGLRWAKQRQPKPKGDSSTQADSGADRELAKDSSGGDVMDESRSTPEMET